MNRKAVAVALAMAGLGIGGDGYGDVLATGCANRAGGVAFVYMGSRTGSSRRR